MLKWVKDALFLLSQPHFMFQDRPITEQLIFQLGGNLFFWSKIFSSTFGRRGKSLFSAASIFLSTYLSNIKSLRLRKRDIGWDYGTLDGAILILISMLFKAHSKQKDIKQGDSFFYLNAFVAHSKQWAGFFRAVRLFNMGISYLFFFCI